MDFQSMVGVPTDPVANEQRLRQNAKIPYPAFQAVIGAFFGITILAFTARVAHRLKTRRRLSLEDWILMFSVACLSVVTAIAFKFTRIVYLFEAAATSPRYYIFTTQDISVLQDSSSVVLIGDSGMVMFWTSIHSVKFFFLALFRLLIKRISRRITIYFWIVVAVTTLFWFIQLSISTIPCFQLELLDEYKCLFRMTKLQPWANGGDILTDIMIISIPILVLRKSQMKSCKKLGLGVFLCLSFVMILLAFARSFGYLHGASAKASWQYLWLYLEASIAIIMASITAFSAFVLTKDNYKAPNQSKKNQSQPYSFKEYLRRKKVWRNRLEWEERDGEHLPHVPSATLTGMHTFIHRQGRSTVATEPMQSTPHYSLNDESLSHP